jgi:hypothetical protein
MTSPSQKLEPHHPEFVRVACNLPEIRMPVAVTRKADANSR